VATASQWIQGARPRTLPAAFSPVIAGTGVAVHEGAWDHPGGVWWKAVLSLVVALALQIGVNYANDYSDGVRGTDDDRVGPLRLTGSRLASPAQVKAAAFGCFGIAAVAGLVLAAATAWWLIAVGVLCILAAWYYTGGKRPYGYHGLGELMVFVFFGLVAVNGTTYVQTKAWTWGALWASIGIGILACALLVANNLRDIPGDTVSGKRTLAVRLGDRQTRELYLLFVAVALVMVVLVAGSTSWWALIGIAFLQPAARAAAIVGNSKNLGPGLIPALQATGMAELSWAVLVAVPLVLAKAV
jgi:1,4-dihydroxy-2-naphthoate polyprenyltransferase